MNHRGNFNSGQHIELKGSSLTLLGKVSAMTLLGKASAKIIFVFKKSIRNDAFGKSVCKSKL